MNISYEDIHVTIGRKEILKGVTLSSEEGRMTGIIGPNGCGKSTLIKTTFGICAYSKGNILVDSEPVKNYTPRKLAAMIGYVGQDAACAFDFSVFDVVSMGMFARKDRSKPAKEVVEKALEELCIAQLKDRSILSLSGGERKMVFIARAIAQNADILILDEPTNHLDIKNQLFLLEYLKGSGKTVLIVLHDLRLASHFCDKVYLLSQGKIEAEGRPLEALGRDNVKKVFDISGNACRNMEGEMDFSLFGS
jgi:iron complex transport system ATP-binding protein